MALVDCKLLAVVGLRLSEDESDYLWEKRNYLCDYPSALPRMIQVRFTFLKVYYCCRFG